MRKELDPFSKDLLNRSSILAAIDTYDMALVVKAASKELGLIGLPRNPSRIRKSKMDSTVFRNTGNEHYKAGRIRLALEFYNKALAFAPKSSEEMVLAYGNRSAVFFSIRYFHSCLVDIDTCLKLGCSEALATKLRKRRDEVLPFKCEEFTVQMMSSSHFIRSYLQFDCERNAEVPCASASVAFVTQDGAKRAASCREIKVGSVVAIERAFVTSPIESVAYVTCYYCNRAELLLYPCEGCCKVLFCGTQCQIRCMKEYHRIECHIASDISLFYDDHVNMLVVRATIKLSLKMTWDEFITESKNIGAARMRKSNVQQTFSPKEALSILSYDDDVPFIEGRMYNGSIVCACVLHCLSGIIGYFPMETVKREAAADAIARVMLHLYVTFTKRILILSSAYDLRTTSFRNNMLVHSGWFAMSSKLRHSCKPNLMVVGLNDSVALVALRTIKAGEELTIAYNGYRYFRSNGPSVNDRIIELFIQTRYICDCKLCRTNWNRNSAVNVEMTKKQTKLFVKLKNNMKWDYKYFNVVCEALDTFPMNSKQHVCAYDALQVMLNVIQSKYFNNFTYTATVEESVKPEG